MKSLWSSLILTLALFACQPKESRESISLAGTWELRLDSAMVTEQVQLPGTTDTNQKGFPNTDRDETTHLARLFHYQGKAWYQREVSIPNNWEGKEIWLTLERTKPTQIWVDGTFAGSSNDISTPQTYELSSYLTTGKHTLTIMVDNGLSVPPQLLENSHAYTESTQTNWNGIIGEIKLETRPSFHIRQIQVAPHADTKTADVSILLNNPSQEPTHVRIQIKMEAFNTSQRHNIHFQKDTTIGQEAISLHIPMGKDALTWSEFAPSLYRLTAEVKGDHIYDSQSTTFGLRDFNTKGTQFTINGLTTFLRGKHDACVFPLTGHVPMDTTQWRRYFHIAKAYGINHCRFHSWCPPEACFIAADLEGFYLQPELPFWGTIERKDTTLVNFLTKEGLHIQEAYGNHASFVMMAIGNELYGDQEVMVEMIDRFRAEDGRHLYASGSNNYLGYKGPATSDDYFTSCRIPGDNTFDTHTRGSFSFADAEDGGYINHTYPNSIMSFEPAIKRSTLPIIGHETGQFQAYPNYEEIKKYTGVLKPWNLEVFRQRLEDANMAAQANDFFRASGAWMARLYKAEMEMAFRTPGMAGFHLLDLQDYPGQGTALVGILDAFLDSKGFITAETWKESCDEVVLLALLPKFCYSCDESVKGNLKVANFTSASLEGKRLHWILTNSQSQVIAQDSLPLQIEQGALAEVGTFDIPLPLLTEADTYTLELAIEGTHYRNHYPLWCYPASNDPQIPTNVKVTKRWDKQIESLLLNGANVLWFPDASTCKDVTVEGLFQTDYWNYRMFKSICESLKKPVSPGTLGLLMDPSHPALAHFPTDFHTDWQWFEMIKNSHPLILDSLPATYRPIVQVIDNVERNHKLGLIQEFKVGSGKLLICMTDLVAQQAYPEARQLYQSLVSYMVSPDFAPQTTLTPIQVRALFSHRASTSQIKELGNISYDL